MMNFVLRMMNLMQTRRWKTCDPVFNEIITWNLPASMELEDLVMRLSVFDKDIIGDDFLGGLEVDLTTVLGEGEEWRDRRQGIEWQRGLVDLAGELEKDSGAQEQLAARAKDGEFDREVYGDSGLGFVTLRIAFTDPTQPPPVTPPCVGVLTVSISGCSGLLAADRNGFSDPYVTLQLGDLPVQRTRVRPKTLDPEFEESFRWRLDPDQLSIEDMRNFTLKIWDEDEVAGFGAAVEDDFLGELGIDLMEELGEGGEWLTRSADWERPITDTEKVTMQDKRMRKQVNNRRAEGEADPFGTITLKIAFKEPMKRPTGKLQVVVLTCRGLLAADANEMSDPFVEVSVGSDPKPQRTHRVLQTLNPRFNRPNAPNPSMFEFVMDDDVSPADLTLSAAVYDWDKLRADDFLGMVEVHLENEWAGGWGAGWIEKEFPLVDSWKRELERMSDRPVRKQIKKRRGEGVHPYGFMRLRMQFLADVPPAPTKLALRADVEAKVGEEFAISVYVKDSSGWHKEPLMLSLNVLPQGPPDMDARTVGENQIVPLEPVVSSVRTLADLKESMRTISGLSQSRWVSLLDPNEQDEPEGLPGILDRTTTKLARLAPEEERDENDDVEDGRMVALPGSMMSLARTSTLAAANAARVRRKVKVKKGQRGDVAQAVVVDRVSV